MRTVARTKTSRNRPVKRPKVATLFCAEGLRASACVVLDALSVRGWSVQLRTGDAAREALKRFRDPKAGLRVLCLAEPVDPATKHALHKALDPLGRGDLLIVDFFTPRTVVESILKFSGYRVGARRPRAQRRTTRSYLAQPTLVEQTVDINYWSRYGIGAAAAGVAVMVGMSTFFAVKSAPSRPPAATAAGIPATPSPLVDRSALSATVPVPSPLLEPEPQRPVPKAAAAPIPEEPPATLEEVELPEVPIEGLIVIERERPATSAIMRGGAPGLPQAPRIETIDPFEGR
jgi:hypothetical protein